MQLAVVTISTVTVARAGRASQFCSCTGTNGSPTRGNTDCCVQSLAGGRQSSLENDTASTDLYFGDTQGPRQKVCRHKSGESTPDGKMEGRARHNSWARVRRRGRGTARRRPKAPWVGGGAPVAAAAALPDAVGVQGTQTWTACAVTASWPGRTASGPSRRSRG